ncbi:MAG TPA: glycerol-3-phosphate dehydrogenase [Deltaproteobacteria bacterium]|nr:glycerol-3-phosphate dehydrogenase [Deltaproteobacteria bacterium]HCP47676.1 glycerol-3-phosphate dehydrogenase [Deltaproteobacteria bacterium]
MTASLRCGVLGAGSFGTALASVLLKGDHSVTMWCFEPGHADEINEAGRNTRYMTDFALPGLRATSSLPEAVAGQDLVLFVSPSHVTRLVAREASEHVEPGSLLVCATKGIESSGETMDEVLREELPEAVHSRLAYLSGPSFAREVLEEHPTAVVVAGRDDEVVDVVQKAFARPFFRVYGSHDVTGVELGGAVKNIIAIAAGCSDGLGFGHNARAAIITRGLAEMSRLGVACGAEPLTFMGLAGMGDLVLTCTGDLSRNRTVGKGLGSGMTLAEVTESLGGQVAEGVRTTASTTLLAQKMGMEMPLVEGVRQVLYDDRDPREVVAQLMGRPLKRELD